MTISGIDIAVVFICLVGIAVFGIVVGYRRHASTDSYFLASKSLGWFTVGAAMAELQARRSDRAEPLDRGPGRSESLIPGRFSADRD